MPNDHIEERQVMVNLMPNTGASNTWLGNTDNIENAALAASSPTPDR